MAKYIQCGYCSGDTPIYHLGVSQCVHCGRNQLIKDIGGRLWVYPVDTDEYTYIGYELVDYYALPPICMTRQSAGYDLTVVEGGIVAPGVCRVFDTGVRYHMVPPLSFALQGRSSWFQRGLVVNPGLIDADFKDTVKILVRNVRLLPIRVKRGDRLAQVALPPYVKFAQHDTSYTVLAPVAGDIRAGGLGSTGR